MKMNKREAPEPRKTTERKRGMKKVTGGRSTSGEHLFCPYCGVMLPVYTARQTGYCTDCRLWITVDGWVFDHFMTIEELEALRKVEPKALPMTLLDYYTKGKVAILPPYKILKQMNGKTGDVIEDIFWESRVWSDKQYFGIYGVRRGNNRARVTPHRETTKGTISLFTPPREIIEAPHGRELVLVNGLLELDRYAKSTSTCSSVFGGGRYGYGYEGPWD